MDVKGIIRQRGYTMEKVADEMGINRVTLSQNLSRNPTIATLQRIADVLGCRVGDFFRDEIEDAGALIICPHCGHPIHINVTA